MKIKVGDSVQVTAGKDQGRQGKVTKVFPRTYQAVVEGVNIYKKHVKPKGEGKPGGIIDVQKPLPIANLAMICGQCKQPTRIGFQITDKGKIRICRKCQKEIGK